jgi:catechol 2,3-dioxygenase-like lactoylglutathione lyase family enzyme
MTTATPLFDQVNLIVGDLDRALDFYGRLGLAVPSRSGDWPPASGAQHADLSAPGGLRLELDNLPMARIWHGAAAGVGHVLTFSLPTREAVDLRYGALVDAGFAARLRPYDAFWGARFAIVQDPDGNDVGLMSPTDPERRFTPSPVAP